MARSFSTHLKDVAYVDKKYEDDEIDAGGFDLGLNGLSDAHGGSDS